MERVLVENETRKPTDSWAELKTPASRQKYMKEAVQKGQEKIPRFSSLTTGAGTVAGLILSANKGMIKLMP